MAARQPVGELLELAARPGEGGEDATPAAAPAARIEGPLAARQALHAARELGRPHRLAGLGVVAAQALAHLTAGGGQALDLPRPAGVDRARSARRQRPPAP